MRIKSEGEIMWNDVHRNDELKVNGSKEDSYGHIFLLGCIYLLQLYCTVLYLQEETERLHFTVE